MQKEETTSQSDRETFEELVQYGMRWLDALESECMKCVEERDKLRRIDSEYRGVKQKITELSRMTGGD
ncbi:MAG: hypothetical protein IJU76_15310 [Desulfovibrionaceae bacterium]|nr:hypothetical protein [Desulfovibrionaceae bacterium]